MDGALRLHIFLWLLFSLAAASLASAIPHTSYLSPSPRLVVSRGVTPIISNVSGTIQVTDPTTNQAIAQGPATDGSGSGFDASAIIWIGFSLGLGAPLAFAGIRGWRLTQGSGFGFGSALAGWASIINSVNNVGVSDIFLTTIVLGLFGVGFIIGVFKYARVAGILFLAIEGGISIGLRVVLTRPNLLISNANLYALNWIIIAVFGVAGGLSLVLNRRAAILVACTSTGSFLLALGADLILERQSGISRGLRFLMDKNDNHAADIIQHGYSPPLTTLIIILASLGLIPVLAYAQHRIFKDDFDRTAEVDDSELQINYPTVMYDNNGQRVSLFPTFDPGRIFNKDKDSSRFSM